MKNEVYVKCQVCGESGVGSIQCLDWSNFVSHKDPRVCAENLKRKLKHLNE